MLYRCLLRCPPYIRAPSRARTPSPLADARAGDAIILDIYGSHQVILQLDHDVVILLNGLLEML
jgi:hypothetical protein